MSDLAEQIAALSPDALEGLQGLGRLAGLCQRDRDGFVDELLTLSRDDLLLLVTAAVSVIPKLLPGAMT